MEPNTIIINDYEILTRANEFKQASNQIKNSMGISVPFEITTCFSCELYFKYLINFIQNNKTSVSKDNWIRINHDLKKLYENLDTEIGNNIKNIINQKMGFDISEQLEKVGNNFADIRYDYEHEKVTYSPYFLYNLMNVLSDICNDENTNR